MAAPCAVPAAPEAYAGGTHRFNWLWLPFAFSTVLYVLVMPAAQRNLGSRVANDYYAWMSDAFLSGQLHLKIEADPRLLTMANPTLTVPGENIPRLPEACYYRGRYYLYFSALPALLVFIPGVCFWHVPRRWVRDLRVRPGWDCRSPA